MKRDLFAEISEGFDALSKQRTQKVTLRTVEVALNPAPEVILPQFSGGLK
jgi:hypothetical protein